LGAHVAMALGARLDGAEFSKTRMQLHKFYDAHFHLLDVGIALPLSANRIIEGAPPSLLRRFTPPDVLVRDPVSAERRERLDREGLESSSSSGLPAAVETEERQQITTARPAYLRRTPLTQWMADGMHLAITGEPGSGKSTLLRCIALDLLTQAGVFPQVCRRYGGYLPLHLSFSRWSRLSATLHRAASLKDVVAETLQTSLTAGLSALLNRAIDERRVLLLLDGLDEWIDEQAARTTLQHILAFVEAHGVPIIVTARPRGLDKIGAIPVGWRTAELAPLSPEQQRTLAKVWFARTIRLAECPEEGGARGPIEARVDRFFAELARDRRLLSLATNPLLLIGLIALSIRQIALPRNRMQAIHSLVAILIEVHPEQRATAAGDTQTRFQHIPDAEDRRAALARLAFVARSASGGGTYDMKAAKKTIREYLADPTTLGYSAERAHKAAGEMLAVNAETLGILAERAPGEVGFTHAVFEEYLAAEHLQGWAFSELKAFVHEKSGEPIWRNVISYLVSLQTRPNEVEALIEVIEVARAVESRRETTMSRDVLLADIAFNASRKPPATAQRLINRAFDVIERGEWMLARREVLKAALFNMADAVSSAPVDDRLPRWAPRRARSFSGLFDVLGTWERASDVRDVLLGGLRDEDRNTQLRAARALARMYAGDGEIEQRLKDILRLTMDMSIATAALHALTVGWPQAPELPTLHDAATTSRDPTLRLIGVAGRLAAKRVDRSDKDALLALMFASLDSDFRHQAWACSLLVSEWPDDPDIIDLALDEEARDGSQRGRLAQRSATEYLLRCSPHNVKVVDWIKFELAQPHPYPLAYGDFWDAIIPFVVEWPDIRAAVVALVRSEFGRHTLYRLQRVIPKIGGLALRDALIDIARKAEGSHVLWAVRPLLEGWDRSDPIVLAFIDEVAQWDDERLKPLAALLPKILPELDTTRQRLLSMARGPQRPPFEAIVRGLASLGCTAEDEEVVDTLLATIDTWAPELDASIALLHCFSGHPKVKEHALKTFRLGQPPLAVLARAYESDPEIRKEILSYANPLPAVLRADMAEVASTEANSRSAFDLLLERYDFEVEDPVKIAGAIHYHKHSLRAPTADQLQKLVASVRDVAHSQSVRRAAAFVGLLLLGRIGEFASMTDEEGEPLRIPIGSVHGQDSEGLASLMCERWDELKKAFGTNSTARLVGYGSGEGEVWDCLAPHINSSESARHDFLAYCARPKATLGPRSFLTLAREQPASELLLAHCWRVLGEKTRSSHLSPLHLERTRFEIAYVLRDQFRHRSDVKERLREAFKLKGAAEFVALTLIEPNDPLLQLIRVTPLEMGRERSHWVRAVHLAGAQSNAEAFTEVALAMINRLDHGIWDFQDITNRALIDRLRRDGEVVELFKDKLASNPTESERASLPRYLLSAGGWDACTYKLCQSLLEEEAGQPLPRAGYDAIEDDTRAVSQSLLAVLTSSVMS
jgi:energy-coupling factor transporter ATP-binding protein EcfA2